MERRELAGRDSSGRWRVAALGIFAVVAFCLALQSTVRGVAGDAGPLKSPTLSLVSLHMKFEGATTCKDAKCHGAADPQNPPARPGNEYSVWSNKDKHHTAFATLASARSKDIAKELKIADAQKSDRCLGCHALNAPADLRGKNFSISDGVTCNGCHGPSEKWSEPHSKKDWLVNARKANPDHAALLASVGIYDTHPVDARAERCTSCHLAIEADLVKAKHPQPVFELAFFSESEPKHWVDPTGLFNVQLWAGGQAVCLRDAMLQLADRAAGSADDAQVSEAYTQALSHYVVFRQALATGAVPGDAAALDAAVQKLRAAGGATGSKSPAVATEAANVAKLAADLVKPASSTEPDEAKTLKLVKAIATDDEPAKIGPHGQEQQGMAIYELYTTYSTSKAIANDPLLDAVSKLPSDPGTPVPADYATTLADVRAKLAK